MIWAFHILLLDKFGSCLLHTAQWQILMSNSYIRQFWVCGRIVAKISSAIGETQGVCQHLCFRCNIGLSGSLRLCLQLFYAVQAGEQPTPPLTAWWVCQRGTAVTSASNIIEAISIKKPTPKISLKSNWPVNRYIIWFICHTRFVKASTH